MIAVKDDERICIFDEFLCASNRVSGTELFFLNGVRASSTNHFTEAWRIFSNHNNRIPLETRCFYRLEQVLQNRLPRNRSQRLRNILFHARTFSGREDDDSEFHTISSKPQQQNQTGTRSRERR